MRLCRMGLSFIVLALVGSAGAGVYVDAQTDVRQRPRIATNEVTFAWDWDWPWVPSTATEAKIVAKGHHFGWTNTVARPATSTTWKLFELPAPQILDDVIDVTLSFVPAGGLAVSQTVTYELRAASFGQTAIRACETNSPLWTKLEFPCVIPFDVLWFDDYKRGSGFTYIQFRDVADNVVKAGPPWGAFDTVVAGYQTMPSQYLPQGEYWVELWNGSTKIVWTLLKSRQGSIIIVR